MNQARIRIWCPHENMMLESGFALIDNKVFLIFGDDLTEVLNPKIMLSTGRKDQDGIEIFENDLIEYPLYESDPFYAQCLGRVRNVGGVWIVESLEKVGHISTSIRIDGSNSLKVRGNFYQNLSLKKQRQYSRF